MKAGKKTNSMSQPSQNSATMRPKATVPMTKNKSISQKPKAIAKKNEMNPFQKKQALKVNDEVVGTSGKHIARNKRALNDRRTDYFEKLMQNNDNE